MEPDSGLPKCLSQSLGYALGAAARELRNQTNTALAPLGIAGQAFTLLALADDAEPKTQVQIGARLGIVPSGTSGLVKELVAAGLIVCARHPTNRRESLVSLTPKGRRTLAEGQKIIEETEREFFRSLGDNDREHLKRLLVSLTD